MSDKPGTSDRPAPRTDLAIFDLIDDTAWVLCETCRVAVRLLGLVGPHSDQGEWNDYTLGLSPDYPNHCERCEESEYWTVEQFDAWVSEGPTSELAMLTAKRRAQSYKLGT